MFEYEMWLNDDLLFADVVYRDLQVQLRFCLLETSCEQQDKFPSGIGVRVNHKPAQLPVGSFMLT